VRGWEMPGALGAPFLKVHSLGEVFEGVFKTARPARLNDLKILILQYNLFLDTRTRRTRCFKESVQIGWFLVKVLKTACPASPRVSINFIKSYYFLIILIKYNN